MYKEKRRKYVAKRRLLRELLWETAFYGLDRAALLLFHTL